MIKKLFYNWCILGVDLLRYKKYSYCSVISEVIMMTPKMGRPPIDNPKQHEIRTRVDNTTYLAIEEYCKKENITRSIFLRRAIDMALSIKK